MGDNYLNTKIVFPPWDGKKIKALIMKNKKMLYGILVVVIAIVGISLLIYTYTTKPSIEDVKARHESLLMNTPGVVGVGIGECDKQPCIKVYLEKETPEANNIPKQLEGFKVDVEVTGSIKAFTPTPKGQITVKQFSGAGLLMEECRDRNYISNTADYIIEGTVEKVESRWNEERTSIFTYTDFRIENYIKGTPFTEDKLQIVTPGGTVGEIGQWMEDQPIFHEGKKVRIHFQETNGGFSIVCAQFGVKEI